MKAIMVMYDTLTRKYLPNYGGEEAIMPNFERLGRQCTTFDNSYVGSLPCMPARRELHTGRLNFLHRAWSPLEPFDDSMPELLKNSGVYTHLVSDHQHYWEDGGATYHTKYSSWENVRGQEGDPWKASLDPSIQPTTGFGGFMPINKTSGIHRQDAVNRQYTAEECNHPQTLTFKGGLDFLEANHGFDNWFLQIETFDPHEPFFSTPEFEALYPDTSGYKGPDIDWPPYAPCEEGEDVVAYVRRKYLALLSMCDKNLGRVLDAMDQYGLWEDTMLIVNTDHGYLLGEHAWWSKSIMPLYDELCHTPLFIWDPRSSQKNNRCSALVQTMDLAPTLLDYFGLVPTKDMMGRSLGDTLSGGVPVREYAMFGYNGGSVNITDGRYVYMRGPVAADNSPLNEYTLMPCHMRAPFCPTELRDAELVPAFSFTKSCPVLKIPVREGINGIIGWYRFGNKLYDLQNDPEQRDSLESPELECRFLNAMTELMRQNDAPPEQYQRLGLPEQGMVDTEHLSPRRSPTAFLQGDLALVEWDDRAAEQFRVLHAVAPEALRGKLTESLNSYLRSTNDKRVTVERIESFAQTMLPLLGERSSQLMPLLRLAARTS